MISKIASFKDLRVWQKAMKLVKEIYLLSSNFPKEEQYGLTSQIRRSAISIPSNIAEGFKRQFNKEQKHFFNIAIGSCAELETQLLIAKDLSYIDENSMLIIMQILQHTCAMLINLAKRY